jgi:UDP-glucose 4-epimerase
MGRVLVTGSAGFIGSHLAERLLAEGEKVIGIDCLTHAYDPSLKRRNLVSLLQHADFEFREVDLRTAALEEIVDSVDAVFHQAAQAGVRTSWGREFGDYSTINIEATQRLLDACRGREKRLRRFVYASSSSVYGDAPQFPTSETDATQPISPYGVTKLAGELLVRLYAIHYGLPATSLRYFTVYGPRQRPDMGFHRFLKAIHGGEEVTVYGDGEQTRDFTFVSDVVEANLQACARGSEPGEAFNIGGGERTSVHEVLRIMREITGRSVRIRRLPASTGDVRHTGADTTRAQKSLGYQPRVGLRDGITRMDGWMVRYLGGEPE